MWEEAEEGGLFPVIPNGHSSILSHTNILDAIKWFELKCRGNMDTHLSWFPLRTVAIVLVVLKMEDCSKNEFHSVML